MLIIRGIFEYLSLLQCSLNNWFFYFTINSVAITRDARIALVGRASSQWSFQCAPPSLMII